MDNAGTLDNLNGLVAGARVYFAESEPGVVLDLMGTPTTQGMDGPVVSARAHIKHTNGDESFHTFRHDGRSTHRSDMDITMVLPKSTNAHPPAPAIDVGSGEWIPEVGAYCEASFLEFPDGGSCEWIPGTYKGSYEGLHWFGCYSEVVRDLASIRFRSIQSERDKVINTVSDFIENLDEDDSLCRDDYLKHLYDEGYLKLPED